MASKGKKRGKAVLEEIIENKENVPSRRAGRERKQVNYCEDSPSANKKTASEKNKDTSKLVKEVLKNSKKQNTKEAHSKDTDKLSEPEVKIDTTSKSKQKVKGKGAKVVETDGPATGYKLTSRVKSSHTEDKKATSRRDKRAKKEINNEIDEYDEDEKEIIKELQSQTKRDELVDENVKANTIKNKSKNNKKDEKKGKTKDLCKDESHSSNMDDNSKYDQAEAMNDNTDIDQEKTTDMNEKITERDNDKTSLTAINIADDNDDSMISQKSERKSKKQKAANSTFTLEDQVIETPVSKANRRAQGNKSIQQSTASTTMPANTRRTPRNDRMQENTPSGRMSASAHRTPRNDRMQENTTSSPMSASTHRTPRNERMQENTSSSLMTTDTHRTPRRNERMQQSAPSSPMPTNTCRTPGNKSTQQNTPSSPMSANKRPTPGNSISVQQKTPSSESRVSLVLGNMRKDSLTNTPTSGHCDCASKNSQVLEILELVTDQLTDLKTEMESVKSTNDTLQLEIETSRDETMKLREDVNNLKNMQCQQIKENEEKGTAKKSPKSHANPNEIDLLWQQCDVQKKTIRSLHAEMDANKQHFNDKFDKYKQAMVFILCKTKPDMKHSDVSKLRNLLNKTEKCLDLTLEEICSTMETEMGHCTPTKTKKSGPVVTVSKVKTPNQRDTTDINAQIHDQDIRNGNALVVHKRTPTRENPFQARPKIQRTPVNDHKQ